MANLRSLSSEENFLLWAVADKLDGPARQRLHEDIAAATCRTEGDFVLIYLQDHIREEYQGHMPLPYEGALHDLNGGAMSILINMDTDRRLLELEFIWWENSNAVAPDWSTLQIVPASPLIST